MALDIQFVDQSQKPAKLVSRFQMKEADGGWLLPDVILAPVDKLPHLIRVTVTVTGTPAVVASRIQATFFSKTFSPPRQMGQRTALNVSRVADTGPLPANTICDLTVTIGYFDSDGKGQPMGVELVVTKSCKLFSSGLPDQPPELKVSPTELPVTVGEIARLRFEVPNAKDDAPPTVSLCHPDTILASDDPLLPRLLNMLPDLKASLISALKLTPQRQDSGGDLMVFILEFIIKPAQATRNLLDGLGEGLIVPIQTELKGVRPVRHMLKLESKQQQFPGFLVIDFGTTNSTVTVHDPRDIPRIEGLPQEQEDVLRERLGTWLKKTATEALPTGKQFQNEWRRFLDQVCRTLGGGPEALADCFSAGQSVRLHEALAQMETVLRGMPELFRRAISKQMHAFYHEALHVPTLRRMNIYPVQLDLTDRVCEVASEMEVKGLMKAKVGVRDEVFIDVDMGKHVKIAKLDAIAKADATSLSSILQRFLPSPKRHFGTDHPGYIIEQDGRPQAITIPQLMQGGWNQLIQLTERVRSQDSRFNQGPFRRAVITYPTVAPPSVREKIRRLMVDLKVNDVRTDYDEAVAAAIFYLMRAYSGAPEIGLESFKARCQVRGDNAWVQNLLVFDIGGGTTDVALIRLTLSEEKEVFQPGQDRGAGGRYYKITPQLLSSTGHMRLGGELITLRTFRLLKAALADHLLTLTQDARLRCEAIKTLLASGIPERFKDAKDRFRPGSLRKILDLDDPERDEVALSDALNLAERVLPTRWVDSGDNRAGRLQAFYSLWEHAEKAKIKLGSKQPDGSSIRESFKLEAKDLRELLDHCLPEDYHVNDPGRDLRLELTAEQFETAAGKVVREAVIIAQGALERLKDKETVDWLILSGQSCHLALVDREIRSTFQESNKFLWNPERVTFEPKYAKLATSIGACYAEFFRRYRRSPQQSQPELRRGVNVLYFDINNLFSYLSCSFNLITPGSTETVFRAGEELFELDAEGNKEKKRGKARSKWGGASVTLSLQRQDYTKGPQRYWGSLDSQEMITRLGFSENDWRNKVRVQFEIDYQLAIEVLLCRFAEGQEQPDYLISGNEPSCDLRQTILRHASQPTPATAVPRANPPRAVSSGQAGSGVPAGQAVEVPRPPLPGSLWNEQFMLEWEIGWGNPAAQTVVTLFPRRAMLALNFHYPVPDTCVKRGLISTEAIENIPDSGQLEIYGRPPGAGDWKRLGTLDKPTDEPVFRRKCWLSLDVDGILRLHPGVVPYWESEQADVLMSQPGCVWRTKLDQKPDEADESRNPFSGRH